MTSYLAARKWSGTLARPRMVFPINLLSEIMLVGFDYDMTPRELADGIREGHLVLWERNTSFGVHIGGS